MDWRSRRPRRVALPSRRFGAILLAAIVLIGALPATAVQALDDIEVTFETPQPAVTGSEFTIRPVYPDGFVPPPDAICYWRLSWGNDASLFDYREDETFGRVQFERRASDGGCGEWRFTLPYGPALQYKYEFAICVPVGPPDNGCEYIYALDFESRQGLFSASLGTTDRHIWQSNLPVAYIIPSVTIATVGVPVTYKLLGSQGYNPPVSSTTWTTSCTCGHGPFPSKTGGSSFTFTPNAVGAWRVDWEVFGPVGTLMRGAAFDPPARRRDTTAPIISAGPYQRPYSGLPVTTTIPLSLTWSASDVGWGVSHYQVHESRNGASWRTAIASTKSRTLIRQLVPTGSYRYRVRAVDKAGNYGAWRYTNTFSPRIVADGSTQVSYSGAWTATPDPAAVGSMARVSSKAGARAIYRFTGQNVAWIAAKGPGLGSAKVYIDGALAATISLNSTTSVAPRAVFNKRWSTMGAHRIDVVVVSGPVNVDGFILLH